MNKWFFSNNSEVVGPLSLMEAKEYLSINHNAYGWHPSYVQWKPACCINEFASFIPKSDRSFKIPKELTDKFLNKKQRVSSKLETIKEYIEETNKSLFQFERGILNYKKLTQNLSDDVKSSVVGIEKQYARFNQKLVSITDAMAIAEEEINNIVTNFNERASSNTVHSPYPNFSQNDQSSVAEAKNTQNNIKDPQGTSGQSFQAENREKANNVKEDLINGESDNKKVISPVASSSVDNKIAEIKEPIENNRENITPFDSKTKNTLSTEDDFRDKIKSKIQLVPKEDVEVVDIDLLEDIPMRSEVQAEPLIIKEPLLDTLKHSKRLGFDVFKSVFKSEDKTVKVPLLSEQLKMAAQSESINDSSDLDDEETKKRRRRRR